MERREFLKKSNLGHGCDGSGGRGAVASAGDD